MFFAVALILGPVVAAAGGLSAVFWFTAALAVAVALILGPVVAAAGGLSAVFWFTAASAVAGVVIVVLLVPTPVHSGIEHTDVGARADLIGHSLRDPALARLNFGVFTLHFILMACFLVVPGFLEQVAGIDRAKHWVVYLPALLLSIAGMVPMMILASALGQDHH